MLVSSADDFVAAMAMTMTYLDKGEKDCSVRVLAAAANNEEVVAETGN